MSATSDEHHGNEPSRLFMGLTDEEVRIKEELFSG